MDILIPLAQAGTQYGSNHGDLELRYCLRSIEKFATGYDKIWIVGAVPEFLQKVTKETKVGSVPVSDLTGCNKQARIAYKILWAFQNIAEMSEAVCFFNDDFVLLEPKNLPPGAPAPRVPEITEGRWDLSKMPYFQNGTILEHAKTCRNPAYVRTLLNTDTYLRHSSAAPLHYDIHCPIIYEREKFCRLAATWMESMRSVTGYTVKSVYCNYWLAEPGPFMAETKIRDQKAEIGDRWMLSFNDQSLPGLKPFLESRLKDE